MPFKDYPSAKRYLYGLRHRGAKYGIDRMVPFSEALGHPERRYPKIHIAGTNGKGSTAAMLEAIYRAGGYKTGLYTSPHLVHQGERIQINRQITSHQQIVDYINCLQPVASKLGEKDPDLHPSFFEFMTAMAFQRFADEAVDMAIVETGLGGRLDATNCILPEISIITSISYDHCEILGDTIDKIAFEKAGIIKPGIPVVTGHLPILAQEVIEMVAAERHSPVYSIARHFGPPEAVLPEGCPHFGSEEGYDFIYLTAKEKAAIAARYPFPRLEGYYQRWNAACAALAVEVLQSKYPVTSDSLQHGLSHVTWPGRWEKKSLIGDKEIIVDASHNPEGAEVLDYHLAELAKRTGQKPIVMTGSLGEKRCAALFQVIAQHASEIILLKPHQPRALSFETMRGFIPATFKGIVRESTVHELFPEPNACILGDAGQPLVATGSIYLIGEILEALEYGRAVGEETLQD